jgi:DNA repair protein RadC
MKTERTLLICDAGSGTLREATGDEVLGVAREYISRRIRRGATLASPRATRDYLTLRFGMREHEIFCVIHLDKRHRMIDCQEMFRGTIDGASVHPREIVKEALQRNSAACILVHNHPSGVAEPSRADELITERVKAALALVDINVLDHILGGFCSVTAAAKIHQSLGFRAINHEQRIQSTHGDTIGRFAGKFHTGEDCAAGI